MSNNLRNIIDAKGIKYNWLATQLDVTQTTLQNWMEGRTDPTVEHAIKVSDLLQTDIKDIWG